MFLLPPTNRTQKETNWFYCVRSRVTSTKLIQLHKKNTTVLNSFSKLGLITSIENIKQNIRENIVQCWFYETSINILRLSNKAPPPSFANLPPKF